ncbi:MAG: hypothetical protein RBU45_03085 [Myxococcota bacterium]|jgi:Ser/Thr protein kinase RdoA (MazF antagonist)|nr:hypothetical protein [Myxococcota bacterium]
MVELEQVLETMRTQLGLRPGPVEKLGLSAWNAHYRLELEGRPHHLVLYSLPDPTATAGLQFEHKILRHLQESHFTLIPRLLIVNRESLFPCAGGWFAVTEWITGCRQEGDPPLTEAQIGSMALGLSDLHRYFAALEMELKYHPDHVFVYPLPHFLQQQERLLARLGGLLGEDGLGEAARHGWGDSRWRVEKLLREFDLDLYWRVRHGDPTHIVHGDFRGMNAAFAGERLTHMLDFNCCFNEIRLWDVAYTALGLGGQETIGTLRDLPRAASFLAAYHHRGRLTADERRLLPEMLTFVTGKLMVGAFAGWCITDRVQMLADLQDGAAAEIVRLAGL